MLTILVLKPTALPCLDSNWPEFELSEALQLQLQNAFKEFWKNGQAPRPSRDFEYCWENHSGLGDTSILTVLHRHNSRLQTIFPTCECMILLRLLDAWALSMTFLQLSASWDKNMFYVRIKERWEVKIGKAMGGEGHVLTLSFNNLCVQLIEILRCHFYLSIDSKSILNIMCSKIMFVMWKKRCLPTGHFLSWRAIGQVLKH